MYNWFKANVDEFNFKEVELAGDKCVLITPSPYKFDWTSADSIYRSSIWKVDDGTLVSASYRKFVNYGELPNFEPVDMYNTAFTAVEKVDGSCFICSKYKGEYIFRTRGTVDAHAMENGNEVDMLVERYNLKYALDILTKRHGDVTLIFEWVTPTNVICINYGEADLYFTGMVLHDGYKYFEQDELEDIAEEFDFRRPRYYTFDGIVSLDKLAKHIRETFAEKEGVVCYFENGQVLKKMKSDWYLFLHRAKTLFANERRVIEWLTSENLLEADENWHCKYSIEDIEKHVASVYDWEILDYIRGFITKIHANFVKFLEQYQHANELLNSLADPHEVCDLLKKDPTLVPTIVWCVFRNNKISHKFIQNSIYTANL